MMAVLKRGLLIGGAALAGLLALAGIASAADGGGRGEPRDPEDPFSAEACKAYKEARSGVASARAAAQSHLGQVNAALNDLRQQEPTFAVEEQIANLESIRSQLTLAIGNYNGQINELDALIAGCEK